MATHSKPVFPANVEADPNKATLTALSPLVLPWPLVELLLVAPDAAALADRCARILSAIGMHGTLRWSGATGDGAAGLDALTGVVLATAADGHQLLFDAEAPRIGARARTSAEFAWLGRMTGVRLRQLDAAADNAGSGRRTPSAARAWLDAFHAAPGGAQPGQTLPALLDQVHGILRASMRAESFCALTCDPSGKQASVACYVDGDGRRPRPTVAELTTLQGDLGAFIRNLARSGKAGAGPASAGTEAWAGACGHDPEHGDWLGVPILRHDGVAGALVVWDRQSRGRYSAGERETLAIAALRVADALDRHVARDELARRVSERTAALRETNRILRQQVLQRQRGERLQAALFRIAELVDTQGPADAFYLAVHQIVGGLLYARNMHIALLDAESGMLSFPYFADESAAPPPGRSDGHGLVEWTLAQGGPQLASAADIARLAAAGEITDDGAGVVSWLGVPLLVDERPIGVLVLQSHVADHVYTEADVELLGVVGYHIANALERKRTAQALKQAYAGLERRITERTRALALANNDLRAQIVERERIERRLKYETLHDSLTGLPNRTLLLQRLDDAMARYLLNREEQFAVLFIDLDRFKVINDSVGHLVGDDLLFQVGGRIRACLKTRDMVARLGGDEFAVLLEGIDRGEDASLIAERILRELQAPFQLGLKEIFTSASIGIALPGRHYRQPEELLRDADAAMYSAKAAGRHRHALFDDHLRREALSLLDMENDLRHGLSRNEFVPFYQPIVELDTGRVLGYEALLRWRHPRRGLLAPGDFLQTAEESGCAEAIDWQIFEQVCAHAGRLITGEGSLSINVSSRHFRSADFDERLLALFERHGVPPHWMRVEVTEHTLLDNSDQVKQILENLRHRGVGIVLDDFGTGYSSLSYLHQYPFETLKIDRSFITGLPADGEQTQSLALVRTIQVLADSLHMRVIAEGIEEESQRRALKGIGCRYGQGFLFARARAAGDWPTMEKPLHLPDDAPATRDC